MNVWTRELVEIFLQNAVMTLAKLPGAEHRRLGHLKSAWPDAPSASRFDPKAGFNVGYGYEAARSPRLQATSEELSALDRAMDAVNRILSPAALVAAKLPPDTARIVWARATGAPWPKLIKKRKQTWAGLAKCPGGNSREALRLIHNKALDLLVAGLNQRGIPPLDLEAEHERLGRVDQLLEG
jgi:hypothetical protein